MFHATKKTYQIIIEMIHSVKKLKKRINSKKLILKINKIVVYLQINKIYKKMSKKVLYLHGFASAGSSGTALHLRNSLYEYGIPVISPDIPVSPAEALPFLKRLVEIEQPSLIVATSMGALYAELLHGIPRILVNPSFCMARLLTFRGLGKRQEFRNKRENGERDFKVDKKMIEEFKEVEKELFKSAKSEKDLVWGLFGNQDKNVNCQPDFKKHYGNEHFQIFEGEHFLNDAILKRSVWPVICRILDIE